MQPASIFHGLLQRAKDQSVTIVLNRKSSENPEENENITGIVSNVGDDGILVEYTVKTRDYFHAIPFSSISDAYVSVRNAQGELASQRAKERATFVKKRK